jgi:origin recognition complex subunit 3
MTADPLENSLHIPHLPLIFILSLSSPPAPSPSYLHLTYPRATLALLRVQDFVVPSGIDILNDILTKVRARTLTYSVLKKLDSGTEPYRVVQTMFDVDFEPDVVIGSATIDFLSDFFTRHSSSLDAVITILHVSFHSNSQCLYTCSDAHSSSPI